MGDHQAVHGAQRNGWVTAALVWRTDRVDSRAMWLQSRPIINKQIDANEGAADGPLPCFSFRRRFEIFGDHTMLQRKAAPLTLVVEDEPLVRLDITLAMVDAGFSVIEVPDAEQALELLETRGSIGLVFTDVELAGALSGFDLANAVKERWPHIPVLVTSGRAAPRADIADSFIAKPYDTSAVISQARALAA